jgi:SAM-dependent methyltransferase
MKLYGDYAQLLKSSCLEPGDSCVEAKIRGHSQMALKDKCLNKTPLDANLGEMECARELYWARQRRVGPLKLRWRALTVRHSFHVLPGESILEIGAGSGLWTEQLGRVLRHENAITAAVFNPEFIENHRDVPNARFVLLKDLLNDLGSEKFDYVVGTSILCHQLYQQNLQAIHRLLKPGGQILFFEANFWNPQVWLKTNFPALGRAMGNARCRSHYGNTTFCGRHHM